MLASKARESPWRAFDSRESSMRVTFATSSSTEMVTRSGKRRLSSPLGPFTVTSGPSMVISTPEGTVMGAFPIRLISPDLANDLASETAPARLPVGEQALGGGHDHDTQPSLHTGQFGGAPVDPVAGLGHAAQTLDHRAAPVHVTQVQGQRLAGTRRLHIVPVDEPFLRQDPSHLLLQSGGRHAHGLVADGHGVADPGEHVGDGIGHHDYHDAFLTPGSSPREASSRTQMRHMPKSRR